MKWHKENHEVTLFCLIPLETKKVMKWNKETHEVPLFCLIPLETNKESHEVAQRKS